MSDARATPARVVIGIDFGTANSCATCILNPPEPDATMLKEEFDPAPIEEIWFRDSSSRHVKSAMAWSRTLKRWVFGNDIDRYITSQDIFEEDRITLIKLAIDTSEDTHSVREKINSQIAALPAEAGISSADGLIVKFLSLFYAEIKHTLRERYEVELYELLEETYETVISVPAAWDLNLRHKMEDLAKIAGLSKVHPPVFEPDAAALFVRSDKQRQRGRALALLSDPNAPFVLLDVGGGTADAVIMIPREGCLVQSSAPTGGLHGSCLLNQYFYDLFEQKIRPRRREVFAKWAEQELRRRRMPSMPTGESFKKFEQECQLSLRAHVEGQFDVVKKHIDEEFDCSATKTFQIALPLIDYYDPGIGLYPPYMEFTRESIQQQVFARILDPIISLVEEQVEEFKATYDKQGLRLEHLLFAGGASSNGYIRKKVRDHFQYLKVSTRHDDSATLIASGSVIRCLRRDAIKTGKTSCSLGFSWDEPYKKRLHGGDVKVWTDPCDGQHVVKDCIRWVFPKGMNVPSGGQRAMPEGAWHCVPVEGWQQLRQYLYYSNTQTRDHLVVSHPRNDIHPIGYIDLWLSEEERRRFPVVEVPNKKGRPEKWHIFEYKLRITYHQTVMRYEFIIPRIGKPRPKSEVDWNEGNIICQAASLERDVLMDWKNQKSVRSDNAADFRKDQRARPPIISLISEEPPTTTKSADVQGQSPYADHAENPCRTKKRKPIKPAAGNRTLPAQKRKAIDAAVNQNPMPNSDKPTAYPNAGAGAESSNSSSLDVLTESRPIRPSRISRDTGNVNGSAVRPKTNAIQNPKAPVALMCPQPTRPKRRVRKDIWNVEEELDHVSDENASYEVSTQGDDIWPYWPQNA